MYCPLTSHSRISMGPGPVGDPNAGTNQAVADTDDKFTKTTLWSRSFLLVYFYLILSNTRYIHIVCS